MLSDSTILILEEVKGAHEYYESFLGKLGIKNISASNNFFEISNIIQSINPDLIIIDVTTLNEENANHIIDSVLDSYNDIPLIIVLPKFSFEIKDKLKYLFNVKLFIKPFEKTLFNRMVYNILTHKSI